MTDQNCVRHCVALGCMLVLFIAGSGAQITSKVPDLSPAPSESGLFETDEVLNFTLSGSMHKLLKNRFGKPKNYPLALSYTKADSSEETIPVEVRTRGHFRRLKGNCLYPPLLIQFSAEGAHPSSIFREQKKLKLVMPCDKDDAYIVREWLVYKLYNLVTPKSFRARLVLVKLEDDQSQKQAPPFYGILLEDVNQMAKRNQSFPIERKMKPQQIQTDAFLSMAVFEYLIGNTDWSVQFLQNIKLMVTDSTAVPIAVPYDFDHAGIVNASYARPAEELKLYSIRERRYRGYCVADLKKFENVITQYNLIKNDVYRVYTGCKLLDAKYLKSTIQYLDAFYETISNPKVWQKEFAYPCDPNGTGNVVIQGLKEN